MGQIVIDGARVMTPGGVIEGHVTVTDGRIGAVGSGRATPVASTVRRIELDGAWLAPGFVDLQVNGAAGVDLTTDPARIDDVAAVLMRHGVTSFVPTVVSAPEPARDAALVAWRRHDRLRGRNAAALGAHLEGPMLSPRCAGAHSIADLAHPSSDLIRGWSPASGVALVTIAPELPGATTVIAELARRGIVVGIGHTECSAGEFRGARVAGATFVTHLFNAMAPFGHRDPGPVGATFADPDVVAGVIADGVHVDAVAVTMAFRALGSDRLVLVSDAVAAMGASLEQTRVGPTAIAVEGARATTSGGRLAGGLVGIDEGVRNLVAWTGCEVPDAVKTVTATPARVLGAWDRGRIVTGARADFAVLDDELRVRATLIGGEVVWRS
jgi:N-acetylglucosamine-6-phosphate deacetylase